MTDQFYSLVLLASALVVGAVIYLITAYILRHKLKQISLKGLKFKMDSLLSPFRVLIPAFCVVLVHPFLRFYQDVADFLLHFLQVVIIFAFGWLAIRGVHIFRDAVMSRFDISASDNLRARQVYTQIKMLQNVINVLIVIFTLSIMLMTFSKVKEIGMSILASAGVLGIIIGFAAQKTLGNLIAGIQLAITQPIRLDDVVIIENEWGRIEEINLTFIVVRIWDLRRLVIPLSYFMEKPFQNWTRTSADLLAPIYLYVDYTVPVDAVREELTHILKDHPDWDQKVNVLQVTNTTERTVELRALASAKDSPTAWALRCDVREKLLKFLQEKYPQSLPRVRLEMENQDNL